MELPFTAAQFMDVMAQYNDSVWPAQLFIYLLAILTIYFVLRKRHKYISYVLGFFWIWIGVMYHILFFTSINKAAYVFGALFILQGILFFISGIKNKVSYSFRKNIYGWTGAFFVVFSLIFYPVLNIIFGHTYPEMPTFGLPCPTTIFTFGLLLWTEKKLPKYLFVIPLLWSLIGVSAAISLGIWEDVMLVVSGVAGTVMIVVRDWK